MGGAEYVFPTYVGINRNYFYVKLLMSCVPHIRGDKPGFDNSEEISF